jgi:hypothetical protein
MEKDIDRIPKNADTDIVIRIDDYGGKKGLTIREFVRTERYTGFTKAGTRVPADQFASFKKAINSIQDKDISANMQEQLDGKKESSGQEVSEEDNKIGDIEEQEL